MNKWDAKWSLKIVNIQKVAAVREFWRKCKKNLNTQKTTLNVAGK